MSFIIKKVNRNDRTKHNPEGVKYARAVWHKTGGVWILDEVEWTLLMSDATRFDSKHAAGAIVAQVEISSSDILKVVML